MAHRKASTSPEVTSRLILDSGAVIALARGDQRAKTILARAVEAGADIFLPAVVIAETVRGKGPKDAAVNRVINAVDLVPVADETVARVAGRLLGETRSDATIDALVVATASLLGGGRILTADQRDLRPLSRRLPGVQILGL